jgi:hypothetical protein
MALDAATKIVIAALQEKQQTSSDASDGNHGELLKALEGLTAQVKGIETAVKAVTDGAASTSAPHRGTREADVAIDLQQELRSAASHGRSRTEQTDIQRRMKIAEHNQWARRMNGDSP